MRCMLCGLCLNLRKLHFAGASYVSSAFMGHWLSRSYRSTPTNLDSDLGLEDASVSEQYDSHDFSGLSSHRYRHHREAVMSVTHSDPEKREGFLTKLHDLLIVDGKTPRVETSTSIGLTH